MTDPSQHNQSYAPDFNKPNFFKGERAGGRLYLSEGPCLPS